MKISVVVPSYNTEKTIGPTLKGLAAQVGAPEYEVIVVECSPHERVIDAVKTFEENNTFKNLHLERPAERLGPGPNRNRGASLATGELIVFVDADVVLAPNALALCWQHYQSGCEVFGGALELHEERAIGISSYLEHYFFNHESQEKRPRGTRINLSSAFMCIDKKLFDQFNGFKNIPRMEDTELTERLMHNGHTLHFLPDMVALQIQDADFASVMKKIYLNGHNLYYIRYKEGMTTARKMMFALGLPLITAAKMARILARHLRFNPWRKRLITLALSPVLLLGGLYWMIGFYGALLTDRGISKDR